MTAALEGGEWSAARPGRILPPGKTRYLFYRRLGGPQGRSGRAENLVRTGIRSRTIQIVVSRYTDWATGPTYLVILRQICIMNQQILHNEASYTTRHTHTHTRTHTHTHSLSLSLSLSLSHTHRLSTYRANIKSAPTDRLYIRPQHTTVYAATTQYCIYSHDTLLYIQPQHHTVYTATTHYCIYGHNTLMYIQPRYTTVYTATTQYCIYSHNTLLHIQPQHSTVYTATTQYCIYSHNTVLYIQPQHTTVYTATTHYFLKIPQQNNFIIARTILTLWIILYIDNKHV